MERGLTMNIDKNFIYDIKKSNYTFNRFDKNNLKGSINVLQLMSYKAKNWDSIVKLFFDICSENKLFDNRNIFCFISTYWVNNTRISRYYGLEKLLKKKFNLKSLELEFEKEIVNKNKILFYGIVKLTEDNSKEIFELLSETEAGILFSWNNTLNNDFIRLIDDLSKIIEKVDDDRTLHFNVVKAINLLTKKNEIALYPYAWKETQEYYLDIFFESSIRA